jgi:hypothetical protein
MPQPNPTSPCRQAIFRLLAESRMPTRRLQFLGKSAELFYICSYLAPVVDQFELQVWAESGRSTIAF